MVSTARDIIDLDSSEDEETEELLNYNPFARSSTRPSTADVASVAIPPAAVCAAEPEQPAVVQVKKVEKSAEEIAEHTVKLLPPRYRINRPSDLYWQVKKQKKAVKVYPLRECHCGEAVGLALPQTWDNTKKALVQFIGRNETNDREVIARSQMIPYCGENRENAEWCPEHMEKYSKQLRKMKRDDVKVLTEMKFLKKVLQLAKEKERELAEEEAEQQRELIALRKEQEIEEAQKKKEKEQEPQQQIAKADDSDDDDLGSLELTIEYIRAGDMIEYIDPIFRAGDQRGRNVATVLSVDRKREFKLVLSDGKLLPDDTAVKRVRIMVRNQLVDNPNARFRHIEDYRLPTSGKEHSYGAGMKNEIERIGGILKKHTDEFVEKTGALGKDVMINYKGSKGTTKEADIDGVEEEESDEQETLEESSTMQISEVASVPSPMPSEVDSPRQWIKILEKQLSNLTTSNRRRGPSSHMTVCQLGLAIEVRRLLCDMWGTEGVVFDEGLQKLAKELDISQNGLQTFLEGDERSRVGKAQHSETERLLRDWQGKRQNKVAVLTSQEEMQVGDDSPQPPAVAQRDGDSCSESVDDVLDGVNATDRSVAEQYRNPVVESEEVETNLMETETSVDSRTTNAGSADDDKGKLDDQKKSTLVDDEPAIMSDAAGTKVPATATRKDPPDGTTARSTTNGSVAVSTATSTAASGAATAAAASGHASPPTVAAPPCLPYKSHGLGVELGIPRDRLKKFLCGEDTVVKKSDLGERELKLLESWLENKDQDVCVSL